MKQKKLWKFTDDDASFILRQFPGLNTLYFPLCNESPIMSSLSPSLHGDIKRNFNSFLLEPVSRISLSNLKSSRNFWVYLGPDKVWSITGVSKDAGLCRHDDSSVTAGLLWHKITRRNKKIGLEASITSFVPSSGEPVELMRVEITNVSRRDVRFVPTAAIPVFGRSANNLHDHRHVTSLLNRIRKDKFGIVMAPELLFNELGHKQNTASYFVFGIDAKANGPAYIYPTQEEFTGEASDLEAPEAVFKNLPPAKNYPMQGKEAMAALRFKPCVLKPRQSAVFIIVMGITDNKERIAGIFSKFNSPDKFEGALNRTKAYWQEKSRGIEIKTRDRGFDNWFKWVNIQPVLRKIFGCSFLPDFDYGRGGRGWRDLWQDCLALILTDPAPVRGMLINNFAGVRPDGSNATIIGAAPGEFIADRNNISRVWMDHGVWPLLTTHLYIHQTGDLKILFEEAPYFMDRCPEAKEACRGSILEHILVQNLVQFFNVGAHNHIRLQDADWNDGLDMASEYGESVALSAMYAQNLRVSCELLEKAGEEKISLFKELGVLLGDYTQVSQKRRILDEYLASIKNGFSGERISILKDTLIIDLKRKADWIYSHIRTSEWLVEGFFNGYYNNDRQRVEGNIAGLTRMTLTGQVFPVMSGIATKEQVGILFNSARKYLKDKKMGGFHLNTDFGSQQLNLGRAFSFAYGEKENGAFFSHMNVMFAYALYKQGFVKEGFEVMNSIFQMALDTQRSRIYPCLPEYFNNEGRGMYSYLTGSASWFVLLLLTQVFGVRGEYGDLLIEPKLSSGQFQYSDTLSIIFNFSAMRFEVKFVNPGKKDFSKYSICRANLNGQAVTLDINARRIKIQRGHSFLLPAITNVVEIILD